MLFENLGVARLRHPTTPRLRRVQATSGAGYGGCMLDSRCEFGLVSRRFWKGRDSLLRPQGYGG